MITEKNAEFAVLSVFPTIETFHELEGDFDNHFIFLRSFDGRVNENIGNRVHPCSDKLL